MKLHELVPLDKRLHLFGVGSLFTAYMAAVIYLAMNVSPPVSAVAGAAIGTIIFIAYRKARRDPPASLRTLAMAAAFSLLYSLFVAFIAMAFNVGAALIVGGILGAFAMEIYQAVAHEGTADPMDAIAGSVVPFIAGVVAGALL